MARRYYMQDIIYGGFDISQNWSDHVKKNKVAHAYKNCMDFAFISFTEESSWE